MFCCSWIHANRVDEFLALRVETQAIGVRRESCPVLSLLLGRESHHAVIISEFSIVAVARFCRDSKQWGYQLQPPRSSF